MKYQEISIDILSMMSTAWSYVALAGAVWIFLRLVQACFWLPRHLKRQNDVQRMLKDKVDSYERYIVECEEKEKLEQQLQGKDHELNAEQIERWKERRECLEMLKRELKKVRNDKDDLSDLSYFLNEEETKDIETSVTENENNTISNDECSDNINASPTMRKRNVGTKIKLSE